MKLWKNLTAVVLCLVLVLALLPATVNAATSGSCGSNLTWKLDSAGTLTISGTGAMKDYDYEDAPWMANFATIKKLVIKSGVTTIGNSAFYDCCNITAVTIPSSVTSIGDFAFCGCSGLKTVALPSGVTTIGSGAFSWTGLTGFTVPAGLVSMGGFPFVGSNSLKSFSVDSKNTAYSADSKGVLFNKNKTRLIVAPGALSGSYTVPGSVTVIGSSAFDHCAKLTTVTISSGVKTIENDAFTYCENLTKVTIPSTVTSIGSWVFACSGLTTVTIPASVTELASGVFQDCPALKTINVDAKNNKYSSKDGVLFNKNKTELIQAPGALAGRYSVPSGVVTVCEDAFAWCRNVTAVRLPATVKNIGFGAFACCEKLKVVEIPKSVELIDWSAFSETSLTDIYYGGTKAQWNAIHIEDDNGPLLKAKIHYQSQMPDTLPGDMNDDGKVTTDDAVYLLLNIMFGAGDYPVAAGMNRNVNGDSKVDTNDAVYLLLHVMFGEGDYPI